MNPVVKVEGLRKRYGDKTAVEDLNIEIAKGEIFGLLGHNGAGKTTTIECILGTKSMNAGTVEILGLDPRKQRKQLFERVGVQFQQSNYQDKIKVKEVCEITHSLYKKAVDFRELLVTFGMAELENSMVSELSGGERQKLSVIQALIPDPELVFLDELTTGLDSKARREVWKYLSKLKEKGLTILLTSHYMDEVKALCDRVCILKNGKVIAMDTIEALTKQSPYEDFEEVYLWLTGEEDE
ncbi:ABC transporter ATP-binding protein [Mobilitalea sibirica]|uniref:ABC transporter ATP-binding protein n=1 Tax=Mobilitalea sibirica TaxID=1462919 RepID=A0A8J7HC07_9FIRM|nr:ABC transporter ATP-binding protein [Mobilitalea sibirica]MBH1942316.1 ABC transporter ATP-binding protein [Mobilitalea sibirica]